MKTSIFPILLLLIGVLACNNQVKDEASTEKPKEDINFEEGAAKKDGDLTPLYLEGLYATSTRIPAKQYQADHLFDQTPYSYYSTMPGAGPDEGFMIYLGEKTYVDQVYLTTVWDSSMVNFKEIVVYADGKMLGPKATNQPIEIKQEVRSIYVRIGDKELTEKKDRELPSSGNDELSSVFYFPYYLSIGIGEFQITGKDGKPYKVIPPAKVQGSVRASSTLKPEQAYNAAQLFDSRKEFVWVEGTEGSGEGESLTFTFANETNISSLKLSNGYQRSQEHFKANARIKQFEFGLEGEELKTYKLKDVSGAQKINLKAPLKGKTYTLKIKSVYPGRSYKDLALAELLFFDGEKPFIVQTNFDERVKKRSLSKIKDSFFKNILDYRISNFDEVTENYTVGHSRSLILRSNNTFVYYENTYDDAGFYEDILADGNWELLELKEDKAIVKIFGRYSNLSEIEDFYAGNSSQQSIRIFKEEVIVSPETIQSENFFSKPLHIKAK